MVHLFLFVFPLLSFPISCGMIVAEENSGNGVPGEEINYERHKLCILHET